MRPQLIVSGPRLPADAVGNKLAALGRLTDEGLPVPPFFALTADCFRAVTAPLRPPIEHALNDTDFTDPASLEEASARIRVLFDEAVLPPELARKILAAYDRAFPPGTLVAVRTSTLSEDSVRDAFAGMSDSFLYVPREALLARIRRCWASAFNAESLLYRQVQGLGPLEAGVAVGVQQMALGERSFVMFTCDPRTGDGQTVIAAGYGIGEGVVQEKVGVDHYFLAADGSLETRIADKPERLGTGAAGSGTGPVPLPVPDELRGKPVLTDAEIRRLAATGRRIERIFGAPQDIEGTFTADGTLRLVQSRPVTTDVSLRRQWSNANVSESFPGVTTALTYTFARTFYATIFHDLYRGLGVDARTLHRNQVHLQRMIGWHRGRIYYELGAWYHLHRQLAVFPLFRASWERMMGIAGAPPAREREACPSALRLALPLCGVALRFAAHDRAMRRFETWWESVIDPLRGRDWSAVDPLARIQAFHEVWAAVGEEWGVTLINDSVLSTTAAITERLLRRWVPGGGQALLSDLLCGDGKEPEHHSAAIVLSVVRLAERARSCPALLEALVARDAREVWQALERGEFGGDGEPAAGLLDGLRAHLHRYGDRGLQELKIEQPNMRQLPWELLQLVGAYARTDLGVAGLRAREQRIRDAAERRIDGALKGRPVRRRILRQLLARLRRYVRYRENSRYCRSELFGLAKAVFRSLGDDLAERGVLRSAGDVVHLTQDELFGYVDGTGASEAPQALADARRAEYESAGVETPVRFTTLGPVRDTRPTGRPEPAPGRLCGLGSSGGTARGIARVVLDPREHLHAAPDDGLILVARETDPGWLFLMLRAAGIVVERGTMLSHTAITGRKFGIPTIVALTGATTAIPDGALVEIDGTRGLVTILDREPV